jgi:hypothetical protein
MRMNLQLKKLLVTSLFSGCATSHAGMSFSPTEPIIILPATSYAMFIGNTHSGGDSKFPSVILGAKVDVMSMATAFVGKAILERTSPQMAVDFASFANAQCKDSSKARVLYFSGHASGTTERIDSYALIGVGDQSSVEGYPFASILYRLSQSNCHYLFVVDADPSPLPMQLPSNVTVVLANALGETSFEGREAGGVLTRAFIAAIATKRNWTAPELDAALKREAELLKSRANTPTKRWLNSIPWVQSANAKRKFSIVNSNYDGLSKLVPQKVETGYR